MALPKDSAFVEIRATDDGYYIRVYQWDVSPPPIPYRDMDKGSDGAVPSYRTDQTADNKTEVISKFTAWVNSVFDQ